MVVRLLRMALGLGLGIGSGLGLGSGLGSRLLPGVVVAPDGVALVLVREDRELVPHGCDVGHSDDGRRVLDVMGGCRGTQGGRTTSRRSPPRATGLRCA